MSPSVAMLGTLLDLLGEELELSSSPIEYGFDQDALRENLELTPAERIGQGAFLSNLLAGNRGRADGFRPTLHSEIAHTLAESGDRWMTTRELAERINSARRYRRPDEKPVTSYQIHGRTKSYPYLFDRQGSRVALAETPEQR